MTATIAAHDPAFDDAAQRNDDLTLAIAKLNGLAGQSDAVLDGLKSRRKPTEQEVVRAAITVIYVALVAVIGVAAGAILTMG